ncbi:PREDICTED: uncharacterized protein LOC108754996 isoform X1 [Trachymyrmex septentrionalis]|uniref:uncharacterized protein LOC108754996 isoform X1 n=1 Tax=Trachymyrmex septentrionalis TaxID=34720 RepID=UPI00084F7CB3|nr:PREDICTED: uncharacterized protein LOC108754996 isoform X1 [Trachymyrmex septentrionalis]
MKKSLTFFILALIVTVIADDDNNLEKIAKEYNTDVSTFQECLDEGEMKIEELKTGLENLWGGKKDFNEEQKRQFLFKFKKFDACILKKKQLLVDGKLVIDKIIEEIKEKINEKGLSQPSEETLTNIKKCLNSLNENSQMTEEDKAFGLLPCVTTNWKDERQ